MEDVHLTPITIRERTINYIYIGESNKKKNNDDERLTYWQYKNSTRVGSPEVWTDGGYYFSTIKNLKLIDEKIIFFFLNIILNWLMV